MNEVTKDDLRDVRDTIVEEMREGFAGVHRRQDTTNGRVNQTEQHVARHDQRLKNVEREVFRQAVRQSATPAATLDFSGIGKVKLTAIVGPSSRP